MFEVWCSHCNEPHEPNSTQGGHIKKGISPGTSIWIPDPRPEQDAWQLASVLSRCGSVVTVQTNDPLLNNKLKVVDLDETKEDLIKKATLEAAKSKPTRIKYKSKAKKDKTLSKPLPRCLPANDAVVEDMTELHFTHEPAILHNLKIRAESKEPYTFIGSVLVSINPLQAVPEPSEFESTPHPRTIAERAYKKMSFTASQKRRVLESHDRFLDAEPEDRDLDPEIKKLEEKLKKQFGLSDQSILISGESGSGKTEAAKRVLCHLVEREGYGDIQYYDDRPDAYDFQDRLIGADPILESFGNATTLRNPNSSRFGKFLKLRYEPDEDFPDDLTLYGASITTYLLERSRVTFQETGEKNYRIFYQLLTSPNPRLHKALGLKQANYYFRYLGDKVFTKEDRDRTGYIELRTALQMANLGIRSLHLFQVIAAVLHLGNIEFTGEVTQEGEVAKIVGEGLAESMNVRRKATNRKSTRRSVNRKSVKRISVKRRSARRGNPNRLSVRSMRSIKSTNSSARRDISASFNVDRASFVSLMTMTEDQDVHEVLQRSTDIKQNYSPLYFASRLLDVSQTKLKEMLLQTTVKIGMGEKITKRVDIQTAQRRRDAISKHIYALFFEWLVLKLNENLHGEVAEGNEEFTSFIGVLDVFGFEEFEKNGFEQLLINYANEVLLSLFTREILIEETELYRDEGLMLEGDVASVSVVETKYDSCLSLFEGEILKKKKIDGIFAVMDSQLRIPSPSEDKMLQQLHKSFGKHEAFVKPHPSQMRQCFVVKHYASQVTYTVGTFLEKNDQSLPADIEKVFATSRQEIVSSFPLLNKLASNGFDTDSSKTKISKVSKKKASKKRTVTSNFATQMKELKGTLLSTGCSYIRCVKPNPTLYFNPDCFKLESEQALRNAGMGKGKSVALLKTETKHKRRGLHHSKKVTTMASKKPLLLKNKYFDEAYISGQLKNLGIYDCVNVLKSGLPTRIPYPSFIETYANIVPFGAVPYFKHYSDSYRQKMYVSALMYAFKIPRSCYKLGKTKIFFQNGQLDSVKSILKTGRRMEHIHSKSRERMRIISRFRKYYARKRWKIAFAKVLAINHFQRRFREIRAVVIVQKFMRRCLFLRNLAERIRLKEAAVMIQKHWRAFVAKKITEKKKQRRMKAEAKKMVENFAGETLSLENLKAKNAAAPSEQGVSTASPPHTEDDMLDFRSTFSSVIYESNAMRGTLRNYFDRRTSYNRTRRTVQSGGNSSEYSEFDELTQNSKLSHGGSLFNYSTVQGVTEEEWNDVEYVFLEFDGPEADLELLNGDFAVYDEDFQDDLSEPSVEEEFEKEDEILLPEELPELDMTNRLSELDEDEINKHYLVVPNKKKKIRIPEYNGVAQGKLMSSPTNISAVSALSVEEDNFADFMVESLMEDGVEQPFNVSGLHPAERKTSPGPAGATSKAKKKSFWRRGKRETELGEVRRVDDWRKGKSKPRIGKKKKQVTSANPISMKGLSLKHNSLSEDLLAEKVMSDGETDVPKSTLMKLKETEMNEVKQRTNSNAGEVQEQETQGKEDLLAEANDKSQNFVKRMAAKWTDSLKRPQKKVPGSP